MTKTFTQTKIIAANESAVAMGSGTLRVWGTPAMVAFMENTTLQLLELPEGKTSVGVKIEAQHLKAVAIGESVTCTAVITKTGGTKIIFDIEVKNAKGEVVGLAMHERHIVDIETFMKNINS